MEIFFFILLLMIGIPLLMRARKKAKFAKLRVDLDRLYEAAYADAISSERTALRTEFYNRGVSFHESALAEIAICDRRQNLFFFTPLEGIEQYQGQKVSLREINKMMALIPGAQSWRIPSQNQIQSLFSRIKEVHQICCSKPSVSANEMWRFEVELRDLPLDLTFVSSDKSVASGDRWIGAELSGGSWRWGEVSLSQGVEFGDLVFVMNLDKARRSKRVGREIDIASNWAQELVSQFQNDRRQKVEEAYEQAVVAHRTQSNQNLVHTVGAGIAGYYMGKKLGEWLTK